MIATLRTLICLVFLFNSTASCMEHQVGGKTADDVFSEKAVADLASAACVGDVDAIETAVTQGVDVNTSGFEGVTPLMWALSCENLNAMEALLKIGANPNHTAKYGITPVTASATYRNSALLSLLLDYNGNPNTIEEDGLTFPLTNAFELGLDENFWDNYYLLLDRSADINLNAPGGRTIATFALVFGRYCKVIEMLELGYTHDLPDLLGWATTRTDPASSENKKCKYELIELLEKQINQ